MKIFIIIFIFMTSTVQARLHLSVGAFRDLDTYQDSDANEVRDPYVPMLKLGYNFKRYLGLIFSPQVFYAFTSKESNDSYGGDYSYKTYGLLFDLVWPVLKSGALRFGVGNVIQSIEGEGGEVTVPNGTGTSTAYRPGEKSTSYVGTLNLGAEMMVANKYFLTAMKNIGARVELLLASPFKSEKRSSYLMLTVQGYF